MIKPIQYKPVNWVDGMRLSSEQFVATDQYYQDKIRDAVSMQLNSYNYGLLPSQDIYTSASAIEIVTKASLTVDIRIRSCHAVTADGCRIDMDAQRKGGTMVEMSHYFNDVSALNASGYQVLLQVDPFKRIPEGEIDPSEEPARYPFVNSSYKILMLPFTEIISTRMESNSLIIGQLLVEQGNIRVNERYIPPCTTLNSHPLLMEYYERFLAMINKLQLASFSIIDKTPNSSSTTVLGNNLRVVAERLLEYLAHHIFYFRHQVPQGPPLNFIGFFCHLAHVFFAGMRFIAGKEREDMLKYFYEWRDISPASFEELLARAMEMKYDHQDISASITLVEEFLSELTALWERLAALEYIGQHKENIVVAEQQVVQQVQARKIWTLLD